MLCSGPRSPGHRLALSPIVLVVGPLCSPDLLVRTSWKSRYTFGAACPSYSRGYALLQRWRCPPRSLWGRLRQAREGAAFGYGCRHLGSARLGSGVCSVAGLGCLFACAWAVCTLQSTLGGGAGAVFVTASPMTKRVSSRPAGHPFGGGGHVWGGGLAVANSSTSPLVLLCGCWFAWCVCRVCAG